MAFEVMRLILHAAAEKNRIAGIELGGVAGIDDAAGEDVADFELRAEALDFFALDAENHAAIAEHHLLVAAVLHFGSPRRRRRIRPTDRARC